MQKPVLKVWLLHSWISEIYVKQEPTHQFTEDYLPENWSRCASPVAESQSSICSANHNSSSTLKYSELKAGLPGPRFSFLTDYSLAGAAQPPLICQPLHWCVLRPSLHTQASHGQPRLGQQLQHHRNVDSSQVSLPRPQSFRRLCSCFPDTASNCLIGHSVDWAAPFPQFIS